MVIVRHNAGQFRLISESSTAVIVLVLSVLMVSRVRFRSFKDLRLTGKTVGVVAAAGAGHARPSSSRGWNARSSSCSWFWTYIGLGLAEELIFFRVRREEAQNAARGVAVPDPTKASPQEEEVLRELGAYDEDEAQRAEVAPAHPKGV